MFGEHFTNTSAFFYQGITDPLYERNEPDVVDFVAASIYTDNISTTIIDAPKGASPHTCVSKPLTLSSTLQM